MKKIIIGFFPLLCWGVAALIIALGNNFVCVAGMVQYTDGQLNDTYLVGSIITLPEATINYQGEDIKAETSYLIYPNGAGRESGEYILDVIGSYEVVFAATKNGRTIKGTDSFIVLEQAYSVTTEASAVTYQDSLLLNDAKSGLKVTLKEGESFKYTQPIDVSNAGVPVLKFYPYNYSALAGDSTGVSLEVLDLLVTLTDCYNPSIYLTYSLHYNPSIDTTRRGAVYARVRTNTQAYTGLEDYTDVEDKSRANLILGDNYYRVHTSNNFGAGINNYADYHGYALYFNGETQETFAEAYYWRSKTLKKSLVTDLSLQSIYGDKEFEGFTTGEVFLSVTAENYVGSECSFEIENIGGIKGKDLETTSVKDTKVPQINVDFDAGGQLYIAQNEEFLLFGAIAYDVNLKGGISTSVYYNYNDANESVIGIFNHAFTPIRTGKYTIVYTAVDFFGNEAIETVDLYCVNAPNNKTVSFATTQINEILAGEETILPLYTLSGINGNEYIRIFLENAVSGHRIKIDATARKFTAQELGEYNIIYEYGDLIKNYVFKYGVQSVASDAIIIEKPKLPEYFIKNAKYSLDAVYAQTFTSAGAKSNNTTVYIKADGGEYTEIDYSEFKIEANDKVRFRYEFGGEFIESMDIGVIDVGYGDSINTEKYFYGDFTKTALDYSISFDSNTQSGDNSLDFINVISLSNFTLAFDIETGKDNFAEMVITLTDYYNRENSVRLTYKNGGAVTYFNIDGGLDKTINSALAGNAQRIWYNQTFKSFNDVNGVAMQYIGNFYSDKVLLNISFIDIDGEAAINVRQLNNQTLSSYDSDSIQPIIFANDECSGVQALNSVKTIYAPVVTDILTPFLLKNLSVRVLYNNQPITAQDGTILNGLQNPLVNYDIELSNYGQYQVIYRYEDQFRNLNVTNFIINVADRTAPEITLDGGYNEDTEINAKRGVINLVGFTVSDNITQAKDLTTFVIVTAPNGATKFVDINNTKSFTADRAGAYKVSYYVYDAEGNYAKAYYTINVR